MNKLLCFMWALVWKKWLSQGKYKLRVVRVKGWRTAVVEGDMVSRHTTTPCFKIMGINFD